MRKGRFSEEQMVAIIREADRDPVAAVAKRHGISEQTMTLGASASVVAASDVKRLRQLEVENGRLKKLVAERDLEIEVMKEVAANGERAGSPAAMTMAGAWPLGAAGLHAVLSGAIGVAVSQPEGREGCACGHADEGAVAQYPRYGYRRIRIFLNRDGHRMSPGRRTGCGKRQGCRCRASGRGSA